MSARAAGIARLLRVAAAVLVAAGLVGALDACGKKSRPTPPEGEKSEYPRTYPKE